MIESKSIINENGRVFLKHPREKGHWIECNPESLEAEFFVQQRAESCKKNDHWRGCVYWTEESKCNSLCILH